jgi:DNA polymerase III psi subunit
MAHNGNTRIHMRQVPQNVPPPAKGKLKAQPILLEVLRNFELEESEYAAVDQERIHALLVAQEIEAWQEKSSP